FENRFFDVCSAGISSKARARAEASRRSRCLSRQKIPPLYTLNPSHTASPPWTTLSKTETFASSLGSNFPPTYTWMVLFFGLYFCNIRMFAPCGRTLDQPVVLV